MSEGQHSSKGAKDWRFEMRIRTNTWHYKVWNFTHIDTYSGRYPYPPKETTLLRYVSRILFGSILVGGLYITCAANLLIGNLWDLLCKKTGDAFNYAKNRKKISAKVTFEEVLEPEQAAKPSNV